MRDILDPADFWIGAPGTAFLFANKAPVAVDDALTLLKDSGAVTIPVLANDFDPEGEALTLVSASAALGTAVAEANGTVTYTPPPGISGFDTVVYDVSDIEGQIRPGQVNITIAEPQLSITTLPDNTITVTAEAGLLDITITEPATFAGTYQIDVSDLATGPVNLVPPGVTGTVAVGQALVADPGLWVYDLSVASPVTSWQWLRGTSEIPGETSDTYTVQAGDSATGLTLRQIETNAQGQRFAASATVGIAFTPLDDAQVIGWWDANDAATIYDTGGVVTGWVDKSGGVLLDQPTTTRRPTTGIRTLNGMNVIDFDGSQLLERSGNLPPSGDVAFHMAFELDSAASSFGAILAVDATNDFQIDAGATEQFNGRFNPTGIGVLTPFSGGPFSGGLILSVVLDRTGAGTAEVFVSGISRASASYTTSIDAASELIVMANRAKNAWVDGSVAELIVTGDVTNRTDHHAYLSAKWGLT